MHATPVRRRTALAALAAGLVLVQLAAGVAAAKLFLEARLEAPISFDTPPGEELLVAVLVTVPEGLEDQPVDGPLRLRLFGPSGDSTDATGATFTGPGRYELRIRVPDGGPRRLEVVAGDGGGVPIFLMEDPFTFRPMGEGTARLVAAPAAAPVEPAPAEPAPVTVPETPAVAAPSPAQVVAALIALAAAIAVAIAVAIAAAIAAAWLVARRRARAVRASGEARTPAAGA